MSEHPVWQFLDEFPENEQLLLLCALSVLWLKPQEPLARELVARYKQESYSIESLREAALQLFLLAGFQTSLEAAFMIQEVYGSGLPSHADELVEAPPSETFARGWELQERVYQQNVQKLRTNLEGVSPELSRWTVWIGYGMVMSRPGLPAHWRELLEVAVLAVQGFPRQLFSHFKGALNLGATAGEVELVLKAAQLLSAEETLRPAWQMWRRIDK
ncbi:MAG: carboxymuconolactone decarboxylase family protein [Calditrichaeota bacterium]|nr:carboxymuconolactone decarboxylase family protein [Calditrichota bacterium]MCB9391107.1 carboxymuconolactone decarboxylase family protein [Calditrichota bacterium]